MNRPRTTQVAVKKKVISVQPKERVRDRIMRTARELFYCRGIHAVGVDTIASEAGTNKMSFYRNFTSKDELVAEYLREVEAEAWGWWDETVAAHAAIRGRRSRRFLACCSRSAIVKNRAAARLPTPP